jgi:hypothetical protein
MIPDLDGRGLLPPGLHDAELDDVPRRFCLNDHRHRLWDSTLTGLDVLCDEARRLEGPVPVLVLGGSFFSDKSQPGDVEATLIVPSGTPPANCWFWVSQWQPLHAMLKMQCGLDFYPSLPGQNDFSAFFQYVGPKTAQAKGIGEKDLRGALRFIEW